MSLEAEERVNASTTDSSSTVEQSAFTRDKVEALIVEGESQFREKQEEQAGLLDELAGKLQSLDLSAAAQMVRCKSLASRLLSYRGKTPCFVFNIVYFANESAGAKPQGSRLWTSGYQWPRQIKNMCVSNLPSPPVACVWHKRRHMTTFLSCCIDSVTYLDLLLFMLWTLLFYFVPTCSANSISVEQFTIILGGTS